MSSPPNPLPDHIEHIPEAPGPIDNNFDTPVQVIIQPQKRFPAWRVWDVLAILVFTLVTIFVFTMAALFIAHGVPAYRHASFTDLATNAKVVIGAQAAAYPIVLLFIFLMVRSRAEQPFGEAIHWNWPGPLMLAFLVGGIVLAIAVEGMARFLPIPKSLPMDTYFHDASSAYMMAAFGITLAPLLEEIFFRGLLYPLFERKLGVTAGVVLTGAAFAAIHGAQLGYAWAPVFSIFIVGVVLTLVRVKMNSVGCSFLVHCGYNLALFSALWIASDHFRHLEKVAG
jgi:uncharacterized protein